MSNAFTALIWWVIPAAGLIGAFGYVLWVTQFKDKYETETTRSVSQFQKFQGAFREAETVKFAPGEEQAQGKRAAQPFDQSRIDQSRIDQARIDQGRDQ
jgi:hypothetical protein